MIHDDDTPPASMDHDRYIDQYNRHNGTKSPRDLRGDSPGTPNTNPATHINVAKCNRLVFLIISSVGIAITDTIRYRTILTSDKHT